MASRRPLIVGNWKMYGRQADLGEIAAMAETARAKSGADIAVCPPLTLLATAAARFKGGALGFGAQDVAPGPDGAHTGDVNAAMLADCGATYVIVGHSERRADHGETDLLVRTKAEAVLAAGLTPIICVGETLEKRKAGQAGEIVRAQVQASVPAGAGGKVAVAYEPVWAIGTGLTPTLSEIAEIHTLIRQTLTEGAGVRLLYGGSVKPPNAAEIFSAADVDGALVGGASLKAADFAAIIAAHPAADG
jgi:triosephosphate isomerase (TIM)